jgi:transposase
MQYRPKGFQQMNAQLMQVWREITGATGLAIIRTLVAGEMNPVQLAQCRDPRGASRPAEIAKTLTGLDRPEHILALKPALAPYDVSTAYLRACEAEIAQPGQAFKPMGPDEPPPLNWKDTRPSHRNSAPADAAHC